MGNHETAEQGVSISTARRAEGNWKNLHQKMSSILQMQEARYQHAIQKIQEEMEAYDWILKISIEELRGMQKSDPLIQSMAKLLFCLFHVSSKRNPVSLFLLMLCL